ncbi:MAG TPA: PP2C family protein-serine/threonine phosphatase, partial [Leptospiraceae bacterium]|nr:PP2C family protein-serine/threonine phosphatase [Leptospiraceae bacterium]
CETPAALLQNLNAALVSGSAGSPVTAQYLIVAPDRRSATLASAGHPPPILSRNGETIQMLSSGPMLGVVDPIQARFFRTELQAGDRLFLYTDGLVPTKQDAPDLRMHPLHKAIINSGNTDLESQLKEIVRSLRAGQAGFADDATILGISID